jgi:hypothetical protein
LAKKSFGTIVTFDGGYTLLWHDSNDFFQQEQGTRDFIISMGKKEENYW